MPKRRLLSDEDIVALLFQESDDEADDLIIFGDNTINIFRIHEFYLSYSSKASSSEVRHDKYILPNLVKRKNLYNRWLKSLDTF